MPAADQPCRTVDHDSASPILLAHLGGRQRSPQRTASAHRWRPCRYCKFPFSSAGTATLGFRYSSAGGWRHGPGGRPPRHHSHRHRPGRPAWAAKPGSILLFSAKKRTFLQQHAHRHRPGAANLGFGVQGPMQLSVLSTGLPSSSLEAGRHRVSRIAIHLTLGPAEMGGQNHAGTLCSERVIVGKARPRMPGVIA